MRRSPAFCINYAARPALISRTTSRTFLRTVLNFLKRINFDGELISLTYSGQRSRFQLFSSLTKGVCVRSRQSRFSHVLAFPPEIGSVGGTFAALLKAVKEQCGVVYVSLSSCLVSLQVINVHCYV